MTMATITGCAAGTCHVVTYTFTHYGSPWGGEELAWSLDGGDFPLRLWERFSPPPAPARRATRQALPATPVRPARPWAAALRSWCGR